jgi:hypothetical protein
MVAAHDANWLAWISRESERAEFPSKYSLRSSSSAPDRIGYLLATSLS